MTKLLYIKASPRGAESKSAAIADAYLTALRGRIPDLAVDNIDLSIEKLPEFDGDKVAAKIAVLTGQTHQGRQKTAWDEISEVARRFIEADRYLLSVPMWNGGIPYRLKQYIDVIHQPGLLWGLDPEAGYYGLLKNKKAVIALTSGAYSPSRQTRAFGVDHHSTYLRDWLEQAGVTDIKEVRFQPTLLNPDPKQALDTAIAEAIFLAERA